ncbi:hypothetical protein [Paenibacillus durus]|uniref:Uncharacterized protein n=1 Tax=Paenibacillus durus TaxID=44251 RepID=A0A089HUW0_PAEDU|nr:hypothetical protein [Paenibacillus durus]AIQ14550.1 hypothetical protein PDUR_23665 [Paenibacillus durus]
MRVLNAIGILIIVSLLSSSCVNNVGNNNITQTEMAESKVTEAKAVNDEEFFGDWKIDSVAAYGRVSTLEDIAINELLGKKLTYSSQSIIFND